MNSNKIREGMGFIDEDLIAGAIEYTRTKKKNGWMKWAAMAACLCLVTCLAIPFLDGFGSSSEPASVAPAEKAYGGLQHVQNPVYDVIEYTVPEEYTPAELHIATTAGLDEYDAHMVERYGEKYLGKGIRVFTFMEGANNEDTENFNVWYFDYDGTGISRIYYVTKSPKSPDKMITAWTEAGECGKAIEALASQTSAETPMYLVHDDELLFAIIGDSAYYLPHNVFAPQVEAMPEINTEGLEIKTVILLSDECMELPDSEADTVQFHEKTLNKADLSPETLEWLEWYNDLSETEQLSISFIPHDILELCGYAATEGSDEPGPTE